MGVFQSKIAQSVLNTTPERKLFGQLVVSMLHLSNYIFYVFLFNSYTPQRPHPHWPLHSCWFCFILIAKKKRKSCSSVLELVFLNFTISHYYFQKDIGRLEALTHTLSQNVKQYQLF
ncbi:hypothetical protein Hdeb2414_s0001g00011921 [Helianthus debilis subsp. tardiflorus]